jgi:hypothetical protein
MKLNFHQKKMATHQKNKISIDVSAEHSSESLSFSTLLSAKDLESKSPPTNSVNKVREHDQGFLSRTAPVLASHGSNKNHPSHMSISNTKLQLQSFLYQSEQTTVTRNLSSKKATHGNYKRSSDKSTGGSDKPPRKEKKQTKKERAASSSSFVQEIFQSFVSPCRECHAHKPTVKSMPAEPIKLR